MVNLATFEKLKLLFIQCYQTYPFLIRQKMVENAKIENFQMKHFW